MLNKLLLLVALVFSFNAVATENLFQCQLEKGGFVQVTRDSDNVYLVGIGPNGKKLANVHNTIDTAGIATNVETMNGQADAIDILDAGLQFAVAVLKDQDILEGSLRIFTKTNKEFVYYCKTDTIISNLDNDLLTKGIYRP